MTKDEWLAVIVFSGLISEGLLLISSLFLYSYP